MPSALPTTEPASLATTALAPAKLTKFRNPENPDSDASDSDQSDASARSLSPTRQGLSKTKKKKERRQFGAFADELGDLLGAAFQKDEQKPVGIAASAHAAPTDTDLEMQPPPSTAPKMSRRARQNYERAQARRLAKEQSSMVVEQTPAKLAERRGMTIVQGSKPEGIKKGDATKRRRSRKERERLRKKLGGLIEGGEGGMDID